MMAFSCVLVILLIWIVYTDAGVVRRRWSPNVYWWPPRLCTSSSDCRPGECCRDFGGKPIIHDPQLPDFLELQLSDSKGKQRWGRCIRGPAREHEQCDAFSQGSSGCMCSEGFTCYRPLTGVCCARTSCRDNAYVNDIKECYRNGTCLPPP